MIRSATLFRKGLLRRASVLSKACIKEKGGGWPQMSTRSLHVIARSRTTSSASPSQGPLQLSRIRLQQASTTSSSSSTRPPPFSLDALRTFRRRWRWFGRLVKYTRIPVLVLAVYGLGHQQGIIDSCNNPTETRRTLLVSTLADFGARRMEEYSEETQQAKRHYDWKKEPDVVYATAQTKRIARIARLLVDVGKDYVREQMDRIATTLETKVSPGESLQDALKKDKTFQQWNRAMGHLEGYWTFCLLHSNIPNACVTEEIPKHIFVTTAMLDPETMLANDDEIALLLGHEISHLIHGHSSLRTQLEMALRVAEIFLLSIDPTAGILSAAFILALATARTAVAASYSREYEREADALGLELAARACFDTKKGAAFLSKLDNYEKKQEEAGFWSSSNTSEGISNRQSFFSFTHTHPPSEERYETLLAAADQENADKYCATVRKRMWDALFS